MSMRHTVKPVFVLALALALAGSSVAVPTRAVANAPHKTKTSRYVAGPPASARAFYANTWGVDQLTVKLSESGQLVRFDYRVIDPAKAAPLNERASAPLLVDEVAHVALHVPEMEKVGPLRQAMAAEAGKKYWMVFSNKGGPVQVGHRISVVIGPFRADGLVVQ
jgi:hypothetical protein